MLKEKWAISRRDWENLEFKITSGYPIVASRNPNPRAEG